MCGIVCAIGERDVLPILLAGLEKLEYRGYDSAGLAIIDQQQHLHRTRVQGKVKQLRAAFATSAPKGHIGVAHTRWATHGAPSEKNAHPHLGGHRIVLVHNGILENYKPLQQGLRQRGFNVCSDTDSETAAVLLYEQVCKGLSLKQALEAILPQIAGAYAICVLDTQEDEKIYVARNKSPLVIGLGIGEHFVASDSLALYPVADKFIYLEDGDYAEIRKESITIWDAAGQEVHRKIHSKNISHDATSKGNYRHFMLKEIYEQPQAIRNLLASWQTLDITLLQKILHSTAKITIVACGTSYHAGLIGKYWIERYANTPCEVEIASEFRYRHKATVDNHLVIAISQSGETADTLAAIRHLDPKSYQYTLAICNNAASSLVRETTTALMTQAGLEIGVATTKGFTTQLFALWLLTCELTHLKKRPNIYSLTELEQVSEWIETCLGLSEVIKQLALHFDNQHNVLFLGRGIMFPIALEGALKLKELSYIHAEGYPAGELKHGPLALVDKSMLLVVVAPHDELSEKIASNIEEVHARGGKLIIFTDRVSNLPTGPHVHIVRMPQMPKIWYPICYSIPLQMLAYFVAVTRGTDVDQPRNLAKSVTVE